MENQISASPTEKSEEKKCDDLDTVLAEVGEFGKHQIFHFFLLSILIILSAVFAVDYIVTSSTLDYRFKKKLFPSLFFVGIFYEVTKCEF